MLILSDIVVVVVVVVVVVALASATVATKPSNSTERRRRTVPRAKTGRQSGHDPVLIVVIIIPVRKTNVVGRDSTTIAAAACLPHSCRWSFVAIVHVVLVVVVSRNVIVVANSAVPLWWFRSTVIFCNVCTSSEWNSVKRFFQGSARDGGRYPWLSRHNQPSTTTRTTTT